MEINTATTQRVWETMQAKHRSVAQTARLSKAMTRSTLARRLKGIGSFTMTELCGLARALDVELADLVPLEEDHGN